MGDCFGERRALVEEKSNNSWALNTNLTSNRPLRFNWIPKWLLLTFFCNISKISPN